MSASVGSKRLPRRAGLALLNFVEPANIDVLPTRDGNRIALPLHENNIFSSLQRGRQFLFSFPDKRGPADTQLYFGGQDEQPFLTRLRPEALRSYKEGGETAFYDCLKPAWIRDLEKLLGISAQRQGDIFAVPLPYGWEMVEKDKDSSTKFAVCDDRAEANLGWPIFSTRHRVVGRAQFTKNSPSIFAEGVLIAPDHSPLILKGVHVLGQASNLFEPESAD